MDQGFIIAFKDYSLRENFAQPIAASEEDPEKNFMQMEGLQHLWLIKNLVWA